MFDYQPHLTGEIVEMRPVTADDWAALYALGSDPAVWALHPASDRWKDDVFRAFFEDGLASGGALVAIDRATGDTIGWSRFSALFTEPGEIEIGWTFLGRAWWGGAHNTDMKRLMLRHAFRFVNTVIFRVGETNFRSRRAVEKLGARLADRTSISTVLGAPSVNVFYALTEAGYAG